MTSHLVRTGSPAFGPLGGAISIAREWAGGSLLALLASGSHACGEAVWVEHAGSRVTLSDLDLYAVLPSRADQRAAEERARAWRAGGRGRLLSLGLAAPLECGFYTPRDLETLPARPATLELRRHGCVLEGDSIWLTRVPDWRAVDVSAEERSLLLENRGFDLLLAWPRVAAPDRLTRLEARHAVLKVALDLATDAALAAREYPDGAAARVAWARSRGMGAGVLGGLWDSALAWRTGLNPPLEPSVGREEWRNVARAWVDSWREASGALVERERLAPPCDDFARAMACARRARLRRRLRQAVSFRARGGGGPTLQERLAGVSRGTPQHRLNAAAAVLLLTAAESPTSVPALPAAALRALARLGVPAATEMRDWECARRALVQRWDLWILDGQRTAEGVA